LDREPSDYFITKEGDRFGFFITVHGFLQKDQESGEILPKGIQKEPTLFGGFNLAGCKGFPEVVTKEALGALGSNTAAAVVPRIRDSELNGQRWVEQGSDLLNGFVMEGLIGNNLTAIPVFDETPGTFRVTTVQQGPTIGSAVHDGLALLKEE